MIGTHATYKDLVEAALRLESRFRYTEPLRRDQKSKKRMHEQSSSQSLTQSNASNANNLQVQSTKGGKKSRFVDNRRKGSSQGTPSSEGIKCFRCGEFGHIRPKCPLRNEPSDSVGTGRGRGGVIINASGGPSGANRTPLNQGRGNDNKRAATSQTQAQGSSQPGRVYALTREGGTPTALEGTRVIFKHECTSLLTQELPIHSLHLHLLKVWGWKLLSITLFLRSDFKCENEYITNFEI